MLVNKDKVIGRPARYNKEDLLNETSASQYTKISVMGLRQRRFKEQPPAFIKIDNRVFYERAELERFVDVQESIKPEDLRQRIRRLSTWDCYGINQ